ncbi:unnamed protein product [Colias eurytheme]|nr:unnamed protein product [Colias eurytheme]
MKKIARIEIGSFVAFVLFGCVRWDVVSPSACAVRALRRHAAGTELARACSRHRSREQSDNKKLQLILRNYAAGTGGNIAICRSSRCLEGCQRRRP